MTFRPPSFHPVHWVRPCSRAVYDEPGTAADVAGSFSRLIVSALGRLPVPIRAIVCTLRFDWRRAGCPSRCAPKMKSVSGVDCPDH